MAERRIVSVLFADVVGFTALSEAFDPEDIAVIQDRYFAAVRATLERYGGTLEKFIGDAAVAVFGIPRARDDDAVRAVRGALALHAAVSTLGNELGLEAGTLLLRIGVNTGEVAYTPGAERVTGDTVNVAARLEAAAPPGRVVIGPETALAVAGTFDVEPLGALDLKGKSAGTRASVVAGIRPNPSRDLALGSLRAPTVGRRDELRHLVSAVEDLDGGSALTLVVAPPGAGKSRLLREFARSLRATGEHTQVFGVVCSAEAPHAFAPVADLVAQALRPLGLDPALSSDRRAEVAEPLLRERLGAAGVEGAARVAAEVADLLAGRVTGEADRAARFSMWTTALSSLEGSARTVWLVEDAHEASPDTLAFLHDAVARQPDAWRLVVLTARPEIMTRGARLVDAMGATPRSTLLQLRPLTDADTRDLVDHLAGGALPPHLVDEIVTTSGGNPLFVEEVLRTWLILGVLADSFDGLELVEPPERVEVPTTVQVLYAAQLDDLPTDARVVAQRGSVMGEAFPVESLDGLPDEEVRSGLRTLTDRTLLEGPAQDPLGTLYQYRHALLRDAAYRTLSRADRARLHVAVAGWLQSDAVGAGDQADLVAHHLAAALDVAPRLLDPVGDLPRERLRQDAARWRDRAARTALAAGALAAAREHAERALALTDDAGDARLLRASAMEVIGRATAAEQLRDGLDWLDRARAALSAVVTDTGALDEVRRDAARRLVTAAARTAELRYDTLEFTRADEVATEALDLTGPLLERSERLIAEVWSLRARLALAQHDDAARLVTELDELDEAVTASGRPDARYEMNNLYIEYGADEERWRRTLDDQIVRAEEGRRWRDYLTLLRVRAGEQVQTDTAAALEATRPLPALARSVGLGEAEAFARYAQVEAAAAAGAWDEAIEAGRLALDRAEQHGAMRAFVRTTFVLAPVAAARGDDEITARIMAFHGPAPPEGADISAYGRVMTSAMRRWCGVTPRPEDEPSVADLGDWVSPGGSSNATTLEMHVHALLAAGRLDRVEELLRPLNERTAAEATFASASQHLVLAWLRLARGRPAEAAEAGRRAAADAAAVGLPWWEARSIRVLEAVEEPDPDLVERRVRLEVSLGVDHPQPPPVVHGTLT